MTVSTSDPMFGGSVFQNSVYIGINLENILYGITLLLYFKTLHIMLTKKGAHKRSNLFYALFSSTMVFAVTIWISTQALFGEEMWLLAPGYPGGPDAYWERNISVWYMDWATTAIIVLQLMTDALMIYRCRIIWNSYRIVVVPAILWLATLGLGFMVDWTSSLPGGDFYAGVASEICLAYYSVSVFLHIILTCMICYRVVHHGWRVQACIGKEYASLYFAIVTIIVECVLPYTISGIAFLVTLGIGSPTSVAFVCVYFLMMCISPQLLILRAIVGTAWDKDTFQRPRSPIDFCPRTTESRQTDANGVGMHLQTLSSVYCPSGDSEV